MQAFRFIKKIGTASGNENRNLSSILRLVIKTCAVAKVLTKMNFLLAEKSIFRKNTPQSQWTLG